MEEDLLDLPIPGIYAGVRLGQSVPRAVYTHSAASPRLFAVFTPACDVQSPSSKHPLGSTILVGTTLASATEE